MERVGSRSGPPGPILSQLGLGALADREFARASELLGRAGEANPRGRALLYYRLYALCMAGRIEEAERLAGRLLLAPARPRRPRLLELDAPDLGLSDPYRGSQQ